MNSIMPNVQASRTPLPAADEAPAPLVGRGSAQANAQQDDECPSADRAFHAALARFSAGISPIALLLAYTDWLSHLAVSPQRQLQDCTGSGAECEAAFPGLTAFL